MMLRATLYPAVSEVLGLSGEGRPSSWIVKFAHADCTAISWMLRSIVGSAISWTSVRSKPAPARAMAAATLAFCGNALEASRAVP